MIRQVRRRNLRGRFSQRDPAGLRAGLVKAWRQERPMYTLHYAPDNASLIIRLVLDGAGIPYRTVLVDRKARQQDSPAYRALNPAGLVPTLETPQGPISETGAILLLPTGTALAPHPMTATGRCS
jgi:hypothetical protein